MTDRCPDCGKLYALVGRIHRCIPVANVANTVANTVANRTGRYADLEKRKLYMRELMRKRRQDAKALQAGTGTSGRDTEI